MLKKRLRRPLVAVLAISAAIAALAGCSDENEDAQVTEAPTAVETATEPEGAGDAATEPSTISDPPEAFGETATGPVGEP